VCDKRNGAWQSEWSRHYDVLLWTVTGLLTTANLGLLAFAFSGYMKDWGSGFLIVAAVLGLWLTFCMLFFPASFRERRYMVHESIPEGYMKRHLDPDRSEPRGEKPKLRQWVVLRVNCAILGFVWLCFLLLVLLPLVGLANHSLVIWLVHDPVLANVGSLVVGGVCLLVALWFRHFPRIDYTGASLRERERRKHLWCAAAIAAMLLYAAIHAVAVPFFERVDIPPDQRLFVRAAFYVP